MGFYINTLQHNRSLAVLGLFAVLSIGACASSQPQAPISNLPVTFATPTQKAPQQDIAAPIKVAVALPLSGPQTRLGEAMTNAIQMAFFAAQDPRLSLRFFDTLGSDATPATQLQLRRDLSAYGANAVIGPLFSANTAAIAPALMLANVPVLSFSNDTEANAAGAILLGQQPEQEVARILGFTAMQSSARKFALIVPDDIYGARIQRAVGATIDELNEPIRIRRQALADAYAAQNAELAKRSFALVLLPPDPVFEDPIPQDLAPDEPAPEQPGLLDQESAESMAAKGTGDAFAREPKVAQPPWAARTSMPTLPPLYQLVSEERYERNLRALDAPVRRVAQFDERTQEVEAERAYLTELADPVGLDYLDSIRNLDTFRQPDYEVLLVGEGGQLLRALAPMLNVYAIDEKETQLIGTGLWNDPALSREPALHGGLFAAPPAGATERFNAQYLRQYGARPPTLAATAYDAMAIIALSARTAAGEPTAFDPARLFETHGFNGASGLFRIMPSGISERTLDVMKITEKGLETVEAAPDAFPTPEPTTDGENGMPNTDMPVL
ncbi:MAG: penicillin-binding protein activator [Pseudomonadota bacterium]